MHGRTWFRLSRSPEHTLCISWCPSHVGIAGNERADRLANRDKDESVAQAILREHFIQGTKFRAQRISTNLQVPCSVYSNNNLDRTTANKESLEGVFRIVKEIGKMIIPKTRTSATRSPTFSTWRKFPLSMTRSHLFGYT